MPCVGRPREPGKVLHAIIARYIDTGVFTFPSLLGGDEDHTVGGTQSVYGGLRVLQYRDAFDILQPEVVEYILAGHPAIESKRGGLIVGAVGHTINHV